jgi:hypothetical protein
VATSITSRGLDTVTDTEPAITAWYSITSTNETEAKAVSTGLSSFSTTDFASGFISLLKAHNETVPARLDFSSPTPPVMTQESGNDNDESVDNDNVPSFVPIDTKKLPNTVLMLVCITMGVILAIACIVSIRRWQHAKSAKNVKNSAFDEGVYGVTVL